MYKVKLAACVAAMLFISLTLIPSFGDTEVGSGTVQTVSGGNESPSNNELPVGKVGSVSGPMDTTVNQGQPHRGTILSISAVSAPRPTVVKKTNVYKKTYVYFDHKSHRKVYREVKSWNPVSCTRLDAKLAKNSSEDRAYAKGLYDGSTETQETVKLAPPIAPMSHPYHWGWLWWLLLILLLCGLLGWYLWQHRYVGTIIDTTRGWYGKHPTGPIQARVNILRGFSRVGFERHVKNLTAGGDYASRVEAEDGDNIRYRIRCQNHGLTPKSADRVLIKDTLEGQVTYVVGSTRLFINNSDHPIDCPKEAADEIMRQLHEGKVLRMSDIPGAPTSLPKNSSLYLTYEVEVGDAEDIGDIGEEFVKIPTTSAPLTEPVAKPPDEPAPKNTTKEVKVVVKPEVEEPPVKDEIPIGTFANKPEEEKKEVEAEPAETTKPTDAKKKESAPKTAKQPREMPSFLGGK